MTIYLATTPSIRRKKRMTKKQRDLLEEINKSRRKHGEAPLSSLKAPKLNKNIVRSKSNIPTYTWNPRKACTDHIPSRQDITPADAHATERDTIMDKVRRGEITGNVAEEIVRKSKCIAPAYNKGAVQYISSEDAARDVGKK